ncbi:2,4-dienoyl-CoA reductase-like NADH-dependent reductase (Old Yellow Enzyme family) [Modicisalibacter xianhensis]|uniref:2,4-dienoyl-CoA reductase-like NADH-dependent reductase (Old Yellow Enzyme family) n=2 Tax=Modicisalibacter TaxID=574347 RepID=A0A4R8FPM1_9GAMM|nr:NADH:flavin oxidoreductase [Halomonas xianhensis]TDX28370.1 2,4-dienoyl-CoA reductase-like NADH-dependent reductase (Old Yellow Enzyme family) [Halomonas xianhensis]
MDQSQKQNSHAILFEQPRIGHLTLKNRIALSPMTRTSATEDGLATEEMGRYYARFARGCYSLVITEGTYTDEAYSQGYLNQPGIANQAQADAWRRVVNAVHQEDGLIFMQLMHAGALSQGNRYTDETIAPSSVKPVGEQLDIYGGQGEFSTPREMTRNDIESVIRSFAEAAGRARDAGFDGIEIHGANGYVLDQFLTDYTNQRTDEYGGSTENRIRLHVEVLEAVRREVGEDYPVGIRISQGKVNDFYHKWANGKEDARIIFESLAKAGPDFIHITEYDATRPAFDDGETLTELAKRYTHVPVIANGQLGEPAKAEELIANGKADVITLGKSALANPSWPKRVMEGEPVEEFDFSILQPQAYIKEHEL